MSGHVFPQLGVAAQDDTGAAAAAVPQAECQPRRVAAILLLKFIVESLPFGLPVPPCAVPG